METRSVQFWILAGWMKKDSRTGGLILRQLWNAHHHLSYLMYASRHYTVGHIFLYFTSFIQAQYSLCFILSQRAWMDDTSGHLITAVQCKTWSLVAQTLLEIKVLSTICLDNPVWFLVQPSWSSITITRYIAITNLYFFIYTFFFWGYQRLNQWN